MSRPPFLRALAKKNQQHSAASASGGATVEGMPEWPPAAPTGTAPSQAPTVPLPRVNLKPAHENGAPTEPALRMQASNVSVAVSGHPPVNHVSFEALSGRVHAVVGPVSGGLDPLAALLTGVVRCSTGSVSVESLPRRSGSSEWSLADWWADACSDNSTLRLIDQFGRSLGGASQRRVGHVPAREECAWNYPASVNDVVLAAQWARHQWWRKPRPDDYLATADALDRVGLLPWAGRDIKTLDATQQILVLLARAIVSAPSAVILNRPSAGLDAVGRETLAAVMRDLVAQGESLILLTDDAPFALTCGDDFTLLNCSVVAQGQRAEVSDPRVWERTFRVSPASDLIRSVRGMLREPSVAADPPPAEDLPTVRTTDDTLPSPAPTLPAASVADPYPWLRSHSEHTSQTPIADPPAQVRRSSDEGNPAARTTDPRGERS